MAESKKPSNGRRKHPKPEPEAPAETPEPTEPANAEPAEAEHSEPEAAAELPPDEVTVSLGPGGRGNIVWDGKQVRVKVPGSWIAFPGFAGQPVNEVIIPPEAVEELCRNVGYAVPPTEVRGKYDG